MINPAGYHLTSEEVEKLRFEMNQLLEERHLFFIDDERQRLAAELQLSEERNDRMVRALEEIIVWSQAYPLDIFREPDLKKAHEILTANGMTVDAISASAMRHVLIQAAKIAREGLGL